MPVVLPSRVRRFAPDAFSVTIGNGGSLKGVWGPDKGAANLYTPGTWDGNPSGAKVTGGELGKCLNGSDYWLNIGSGGDMGSDWNLSCSTIVVVGQGFTGTSWVRGTPGGTGDWSSWPFISPTGSQINFISAAVVQYGTSLGERAGGTRDGPLALGMIFNGAASGGGPMYLVGRNGEYGTATFPNTTLRTGVSQWNFGAYIGDAGPGTSADRPDGELYWTAFWTRAMSLAEMQQRLADIQSCLDG